ncbi:MAG TPA: hypothetical protein VGF67_10920 [Ktedonobacteraceae bacterium]
MDRQPVRDAVPASSRPGAGEQSACWTRPRGQLPGKVRRLRYRPPPDGNPPLTLADAENPARKHRWLMARV